MNAEDVVLFISEQFVFHANNLGEDCDAIL
jgi:hypothetical protein